MQWYATGKLLKDFDMWYAIGFVVFILAVGILSRDKPYTHDEWERQCEEDFKKYGPPPDD